jgi:hypothetical protein
MKLISINNTKTINKILTLNFFINIINKAYISKYLGEKIIHKILIL